MTTGRSGIGGIEPISPAEGAEAFEALLAYDRPATGVLRFDPRQAVAAFPEIRDMPYFSALMRELPEADDEWPGPDALRAVDPAAARGMVTGRIAERVAAVLGFTPDPALALIDLGLDSLVAVRIKSALEHDLGLTVPASVLLQGGSVDVLNRWALAELGLDVPPGEHASAAPATGRPAASGSGGAEPRGVPEAGAARGGGTKPRGGQEVGRTRGGGAESRGVQEHGATRGDGAEPSPAERVRGRAARTERSSPDATGPERPSAVPPSVAARSVARPAGWSAEPAPGDEGPGRADARAVTGRDAAERLVMRIVERVLGAGGVGVTDDLRALGMDEARARTVLKLLEHESGRPIDQDALFAAPTVERMAALVREGEEDEARGIVRLLAPAGRPAAAVAGDDGAPGGGVTPAPARRPFFCVHPAGGTTGVYRTLAGLVGGPFIGLERFVDAPGVEERAGRYAALIRAEQPEGPYRLGGWSFGGVVAYATARLLGDVELVALIDAGIPRKVADPAAASARRYAAFLRYLGDTYGLDVALDADELRPLDEDAQLAFVTERARPLMDRLPPAILRHQLTSHEDTRALEAYDPEPYEGRVVLYRATEPTPWAVRDPRYDLDDTNGFGDLCPHLEIVPVPGAHHLNLLDPPGVRVIADHLAARLTTPA